MKKRAFRGDESPVEERAEAKAVKKGAVSPKQYAAKEKAEGEKMPAKALEARGKKLKSGALSEAAYAKGMRRGGTVKKMAGGGMSEGDALNAAAARAGGAPRFNMPVRGARGMSEGEALGAALGAARANNMPMVNRPPVAAPEAMPGVAAGPRFAGPVGATPGGGFSNPIARQGMKKGGKIDGAAVRGKTKGRIK